MIHLITKDLRAFLLQLRKNLAILEEREAKYGGEVPLPLVNQLDDYHKAIEYTKEALIGDISFAELEEKLKPLILDLDGPDSLERDLEIPPPPEPMRLPGLSEFVARETDLIYFAQKLAQTRLAIITGMPGMGNTTMAHMLADFWRLRMSIREEELGQVGVQFTLTGRLETSLNRIFWHKFHPDEGIESVVWQLAGFLAWNGQDDLWQMLQKTRLSGGKLPPMTVLFDYLFQMLEDQRYLLCFDDFHLVDKDPLLGQFVQRLQDAVSAKDIHIIITARHLPEFARQMDFRPLSGFRLEETRQLLSAHNLPLPEELILELQNQTDGNVAFLILAIEALHHSQKPGQLINNLVETANIEEFLLTEVDSHLNDEEREIMGALAVLLGYPTRRAAIETILDRGNLRGILYNLSERNLIIITQNEAGERLYHQNKLIAAFYYSALKPSQRQEMHLRAASYYELQLQDPLTAALHAFHAQEYRHSVALITNDIWAIINQGQARRLQRLLEQFTPAQVGKLEWAMISLAQGQVYNFFAEHHLAQSHLEEALKTLQSLPQTPTQKDLLARTYRGLSNAVRYESLDQAISWLNKGLAVLGNTKTPEKNTTLLNLCTLQIYAGNYQNALQLIEQDLQALPHDAAWLKAGVLLNMGMIHQAQGNIDQAIQSASQALDISEDLHDYFRMIEVWNTLGDSKTIAGEWRGAIEAYQSALALAESMGYITAQIPLSLDLTLLHIRRGKDALAVELLSNALELARQHDLLEYEIEGYIMWGRLYIHQKDVPSAQMALATAEELATEMKVKKTLPEIQRLWALIMLLKQKDEIALNHARQAVALARELNMKLKEGACLRVLGSACLANGLASEAVSSFETSLSLLDEKDPYQAALTRLAWGKYQLELNGNSELLKQAWIAFRKLGAQRDLMLVTDMLKAAAK